LTQSSLAAAAALVAGQITRFLAFQPPDGISTTISLGRPADYPSGDLIYAAAARAYIGHDAGGLYAVDAVCTHLGCLVERDERRGFACPCHGSHFDAAGRIQTPPATQALRHLFLWLDQGGQLMVDRAHAVEPAVRLAT